ncbi:uncharacterized protein LOC116801561 [Drosophila sechellia]|uniref:uncharacterized protein LOC116801561 n=1 Tax=Drosophila sechellia TaxID=7238 RepID=UPI0013DE011D|nr:uncharacterized protein LOC116801561 [Drosophila sechellia]
MGDRCQRKWRKGAQVAAGIKSEDPHKSCFLYDHNDDSVSPVTLGPLSILARQSSRNGHTSVEEKESQRAFGQLSRLQIAPPSGTQAHFHKCNASGEFQLAARGVCNCDPRICPIRCHYLTTISEPPTTQRHITHIHMHIHFQRLSLAIPKGANKVIILSYCSDCWKR